MHKSIAFFARAAAISTLLIFAVDANAGCGPGVVISEACENVDNHPSTVHPKPSASGRAGSGYGSSSGAEAAAAASALQSIGNYLQDQSDQKDEQERQQRLEQDRVDAEDQQRQEAQGQQSYRALESFESSMTGSDWESRAAAASSGSGSSKGKAPAQTSSTGDCNCKETAGICTATVLVVKKSSTGADFRVTSSAPRCSRVNYYIDNTPRLTVLNNTNTAMEHAAGLTQITNKTFEVESCHVCASK